MFYVKKIIMCIMRIATFFMYTSTAFNICSFTKQDWLKYTFTTFLMNKLCLSRQIYCYINNTFYFYCQWYSVYEHNAESTDETIQTYNEPEERVPSTSCIVEEETALAMFKGEFRFTYHLQWRYRIYGPVPITYCLWTREVINLFQFEEILPAKCKRRKY